MQANLPDWADCLFDEQLRYIALFGGRGGAKSRSIASALLIRGGQKSIRVLCGRETQKSIRDSVKRLLDDEIERAGLSHFYQSTDTEIRGINGTLFVFAGLRHNVDSIKSMEGIDICWVEEAHRVSKESLKILVPTIRKPKSQIIFSWNPENETDPVDVLFRGSDGPPPNSHLCFVNYDQNPWFPDVLRDELEYDKRRDLDKYLHVWCGEYQKHSESRVFNNWKVEEFETPKDAVFWFGADWGYAQDPTVLVRCYVEGRKLFIDQEAYQIGCEIVDIPALFLTIEQSERWTIVADSSRPETISHVKNNGFPKIISAIKGTRSIEDGIEWLKSFDIIVHPRCKHTIDELKSYRFKRDPLTNEVIPILEDKHNHVIDALRYACENARRLSKNVTRPKVYPVPVVTRF